MMQIQGWLPGGKEIQKVIDDKSHSNFPEQNNEEVRYWISWDGQQATEVGPIRINVKKEEWHSFKVGDEITLIQTGFDINYYLPHSIYTSTENFIFDSILLIAEATFVIILLCKVTSTKVTPK